MAKPTAVVFELSGDVDSGTIIEWLVAEGDVVESGQSIAEIETDKTSLEYPAPCGGTVLKLDASTGVELQRGDVMAWIGDATTAEVVSESLRLQVSARCPGCGESVAVNGPRQSLECPRCGFSAPLEPSWWNGVLAAVARGDAHAHSDCGAWRMSVLGAREEPACHNCGTTLPVDLDTPMHEVICTQCGLPHAARPSPEWLTSEDPTVVRCVADLPPSERPRPQTCPQCGATAHPSTTATVPRCGQCGADVVQPGWSGPVPRPWWVLRSRLRR